MYALQIATFGDPAEVVERVTLPEPDAPGAGDVLVAVDYAPINTSALLLIRGLYGVRPALPTGVGNEGVGHILAVGDEVSHLHLGDRVLLPLTHPTWRERLVLPSAELVPMPADADAQQLAMLRINPPTAALLLSEYADLSPGEWVIQNAGNSAIGRWVIAFAKDRGLHTVSLVRRREVVDDVLAAGGDVVLVDGPELPAQVAAATGQARIRLAFDGVGGAAMMSLSSCLASGGTLVAYAFMSEQLGVASPSDLIFRQVTIRGFWLETPGVRASPKIPEAIQTGARLITEGKLHVPIAATYPLVAAKEAITRAEKGGIGGKVLFECA